MAVTSKKIAYALFSLSEQGYDPEKLAKAFFSYATSSNMAYIVPNVIRHLELLNERRQREMSLSVETAFPLTKDTENAIKELLNADNESVLNSTVNGDLIGGFVAKYDNAIYDTSIKTQLKILRQKLITNS